MMSHRTPHRKEVLQIAASRPTARFLSISPFMLAVWIGVLGMLLLVGVAHLLNGERAAFPAGSSEYRLAMVDDVRPDDFNGLYYHGLLRKLSGQFRESAAEITDATIRIQFELRKKGIDENCASLMKTMSELLPFGMQRHSRPYDAMLSYYSSLRSIDHLNPEEAVKELKSGVSLAMK